MTGIKLPLQTITLDIEGRKASQDTLNQTFELKRRDGSGQKYSDKMHKINRTFAELEYKAGRRREEIVSVYQKIVTQFEEWLVRVKKRLDSGEILTTDILQFEDHLTVSKTQILLLTLENLMIWKIRFLYQY